MKSVDYGLTSFTPKENWRPGGLEEQAAKALFSQDPDVSVDELIQYGGGKAKRAIARVSKEFEALPNQKLSQADKAKIQARIESAKEKSVSRRSSKIAENLLLGGVADNSKKETLIKVYIQSGGKLKHINNAFQEAVQKQGFSPTQRQKALDQLCLAKVEKESYVNRSWKRKIRNFFTSTSMSQTRKIVLKANQNPKQSYLLHAVKDGRTEALKVLIDVGCDLNVKDKEGNNLLHVASKEGHAEVVSFLLQHSPELSTEKNGKGDYPIHVATESGHLSVIHELLELDLNMLNYLNNNEMNPVNVAMANKNTPVIEKLLEEVEIATEWAGDLLKVYSEQNMPCTILTDMEGKFDLVFSSSPDLVKELLEHDTEEGRVFVKKLMIGLKDRRNRWEALTALVDSNDPEMMEKVLDSYQNDILSFTKMGDPILQYAIKNKRTEVLIKVLEKDAVREKRLESKNKWGFTPLQVAVQEKKGGYIKFLLQQGADPTVFDAEGNSLFHMAIEMGDVHFVRFLAKNPKMKKLINHKNDQGETPVEIAAKMGKEDMVRQFLEIEPSSSPNDKKEDLLHWAVQGGNHHLVQYLVSVSSSFTTQVDKAGKQPIDVAVEKGDEKMVALLSKAEQPVFRAIFRGDRDGFITAYKKNPNLLAKRPNGDSLLYVALKMEQNEIAQMILETEEGATLLFQENQAGETPAQLAVKTPEVLRGILGLKEGEETLLPLIHEDKKLFNAKLHEKSAQLRSKLEKKRVWSGERNRAVALQKQKIYVKTLQHAVKAGLTEDVKTLLDLAKKEQVDQRYSFGVDSFEHPLIMALNLGNREIIECFLQAEGFALSPVGPEMLKIAIENGNNEILDLILENEGYHYLIDSLASNGLSAFHCAVKDGNIELAKKIGECADLTSVDQYERNALHLAIQSGNPKMSDLILEMDKQKVLLNEKSLSGMTPVMIAVANGDIQQFQLLVKVGAKIEGVDDRGNTILHKAETDSMLKLLLQNKSIKALLDVKNHKGYTPLMSVVDERKDNQIITLLQAGAKIDERDDEGNNVLHIAMQSASLMKSSTDYENTLSALLEFPGGNQLIHLKNDAGYTPLLAGARKVNFLSAKVIRPLIQNLIAYRAKIDGQDDRGKTLLHYVIEDGDLETIQRVVDHSDAKSLMKVEDFFGVTPISLVQDKIKKIESSVETLDHYLKNTELVERKNKIKHFRSFARMSQQQAEEAASKALSGDRKQHEKWIAQEADRLVGKKEKLQKWKNLLTSMEGTMKK